MGQTRASDASTEEWRRIAGNDALLHSIAGPSATRGGEWTTEDFYASGSSDWEDFERHWRHYEPGLGGTCVEIGCGAGRLTQAVASSFERVVALDVAGEMIEAARSACPANVEFHLVTGSAIPLAENSADALFSAHVLQHLETREALRDYLAEGRRVLSPRGTMMIHLTLVSQVRSRLWRLREELRLRASRRRLARGERHTAVRMRVYRSEDVFQMLGSLGYVDLEMRAFSTRWNGYRHHFFLARNPG